MKKQTFKNRKGKNMNEDNKQALDNEIKETEQNDSAENKDNENNSEDKPTITEKQLKERLERQKRKQAEYFKKEIDDLKEEIKKSKMKEAEIKEYEDEQKEKQYQEALDELRYLKMSKLASNLLIENGINVNDVILDLVTKEDEEETEKAVENFANLINDLVNKKVKAIARDKAPSTSNNFVNSGDKDFDILSYANKNRKVKN